MSDEQIKPGYKRTGVGVIPVDWDVRPFGELAVTVASGRSKVGLNFGSYPVHGSTGVIGFCEKPEYEGSAILVARVGANAGKLNTVTGKYGVTDNTIIVRVRGESSLPFFYRQLESKSLNSLVFGSGQPLITGSQLKALIVFEPPLPEQHAIADALSDVDVLLAKLDQLIAKKRDLKQATMQQLLTGQTRLPGFSGQWQTGTLADVILALEAGVSVNSTDDLPGPGIPSVLKTSSLAGGVFLPEECKVIETHDLRRASTRPKKDTILISRMNTPMLVGEVAYVDRDYGWLYLPDRVWMTLFKPSLKISARWLSYLLASRIYRNQLREIATGTSGSMKNISKLALLGLSIKYPEPSEQTAIAEVLFGMNAEIAALESRRDKTRALKQGMMQELLTGRIRLV